MESMPLIPECGIMLEPQFGMTVQELVRTAVEAESLGFGYLFRSDHLLPTDDSRGKDSPECWTSLGAVAAETSSIRFGPMVTPLGFRNPALLARMACTLHSFSGGRLQLAVGAGWYEPEYRANGYEFPPFDVRKKQFEEGLAILLSMVREGRVDFQGKYFSVHTDCLPRPAGRMNVIVGTKAKSLVRLAARYADEWNFFACPIETFRERRNLLHEVAGERKVVVSEMGPFMIGESRAKLVENARRQLEKFGRKEEPDAFLERISRSGTPCGTPDEFAQKVGILVDEGVERFYFQVLVPENTAMTELLAQTLKERL
jgi:alkanesulfonate monooxygenase SsuD/methylene tetrahydromethanopterin reductase-like flavin-dependent oxidoreductase (luciferase family)